MSRRALHLVALAMAVGCASPAAQQELAQIIERTFAGPVGFVLDAEISAIYLDRLPEAARRPVGLLDAAQLTGTSGPAGTTLEVSALGQRVLDLTRTSDGVTHVRVGVAELLSDRIAQALRAEIDQLPALPRSVSIAALDGRWLRLEGSLSGALAVLESRGEDPLVEFGASLPDFLDRFVTVRPAGTGYDLVLSARRLVETTVAIGQSVGLIGDADLSVIPNEVTGAATLRNGRLAEVRFEVDAGFVVTLRLEEARPDLVGSGDPDGLRVDGATLAEVLARIVEIVDRLKTL